MRHMQRCRKCHTAKGRSQNTGLYTPLLEPGAPKEDVSMDFILGLLSTKQGHNSILIVDRFSKIAHFVPCSKTIDASHVVEIYFGRLLSYMGFEVCWAFLAYSIAEDGY